MQSGSEAQSPAWWVGVVVVVVAVVAAHELFLVVVSLLKEAPVDIDQVQRRTIISSRAFRSPKCQVSGVKTEPARWVKVEAVNHG